MERQALGQNTKYPFCSFGCAQKTQLAFDAPAWQTQTHTGIHRSCVSNAHACACKTTTSPSEDTVWLKYRLEKTIPGIRGRDVATRDRGRRIGRMPVCGMSWSRVGRVSFGGTANHLTRTLNTSSMGVESILGQEHATGHRHRGNARLELHACVCVCVDPQPCRHTMGWNLRSCA